MPPAVVEFKCGKQIATGLVEVRQISYLVSKSKQGHQRLSFSLPGQAVIIVLIEFKDQHLELL